MIYFVLLDSFLTVYLQKEQKNLHDQMNDEANMKRLNEIVEDVNLYDNCSDNSDSEYGDDCEASYTDSE